LATSIPNYEILDARSKTRNIWKKCQALSDSFSYVLDKSSIYQTTEKARAIIIVII
jgi:hypothetical protein